MDNLRLVIHNSGSKWLFGKSAIFSIITVLFVLIFTLPSFAVTKTSTGSGNWNTAGTWSPSGVPANGDDVIIASGHTVTLNTSSNSLASLTVNGTLTTSGDNRALTVTGNISIAVGGTMTCGTDGPAKTHNWTFGGNLTNNGTFDASGNSNHLINVTFNGTNHSISGTGSFSFNNITFSNSGTATLSSNLPTIDAILTIDAGATLALSTFNIGATSAPSSLVLECGAITASSITGTGTLSLGGNVTINDAGTGSNGATISAPISLGATRTFTVADDGTTATDLTISGIVSGATFGITKAGAGKLTMSGSNTYTGVTTINAGVLSVGTIGNGGVAGNMGQASNAAANLILGGGTLQYTGSTASTDRSYTLTAGTTSSIDITNTLTISGAAASTNGALTKIGAGTLILSGVNNFTGTFTITNGTVQLGAAGVINNSAPIVLNGGTFSSGSGTGFGEGLSTLDVNAGSNITLGTGSHSILFSASNGVSWTSGALLIVSGWAGGYNGTAGTAGKIFVGTTSGGLTATQLTQIAFFNGSNYYSAAILSTGEVVPTATKRSFFSRTAGNWNVNTTWSFLSGGSAVPSGVFPIAGDDVTIEGGFDVTLSANAACSSITFTTTTATSLTLAGFQLDVSGAITIPRSGSSFNEVVVGSGTLNAGSVAFTSGGSTNRHQITISTGTVTVTGNVTQSGSNGSATISFSGAGLLKLGGSFLTSATGTLTTATGCTVEYNAAGAQTVGDFTYQNLTLSNSGAKTTTSVTINGILSMEGTATASVAPTYGGNATLKYNTATARTAGIEWITPFVATGGVIIASTGAITMNAAKVFNANAPLTVNSGATLSMSTFLLTLNDDFINNGGTASGTTGGVTITGTATQSIGSFTTTGTVSMTKTGGTATFTGNVNGAGLTINGSGGTLNLGTGLTHTFTGTWTRANGTLNGGSSTLKLGSGFSGTGGTFTPGTGTVEWNAAGAQSLAIITYYNLTLSGSGTKTLGGSTTINNTLSINSTAVAELPNGSTSTATLLKFDGNLQVTGSWGSSNSSASNKTDTYFLSSTTGIVNVSNAQTFTTTGTFTVPDGITEVTVECWGGGGRGGTRTNAGAGGGGGGGAYSKKLVPVTAGNTYTVTVGAGSSTTSPGGDSWFINNSTILAKGGNSVANNSTTGATGGASTSGIGDTKLNGGSGATGVVAIGGYGGGGGSSAGIALDGTTATNQNGGVAPTGGGNGANGAAATFGVANGTSASGLGGGGGGGYVGISGTGNGGSGANGQVNISWSTCTPPTITLGSNPTVCQGTTNANLTYSATTGSPNQFSIDYDGAANTAGFTDVVNATLPASPISLTVPANVAAATYNATLTVRNSTTGCVSGTYNISVTVNATPAITPGTNPAVCQGTTSASLTYSGASGSPDQYSIDYNAAANTAGFADVANVTLPASPISLTVPANAAAATYTGTLTVRNSTTGCVSGTYNISVTVNATPTITPGANPTVCQGTTSANLTYSATTGSPNQFSIDYDGAANTAGFTDVVNATLPASPISLTVPANVAAATYNATLTVRNSTTGCVSASYDISVIVDPAPAPPTGDSPQTFCAGSNPTVGDLVAAGSGIQWYDMASGGNLLPANTPLVTGTHYHATQTVGGCESATRLDVLATVNPTPLGTISASVQQICVGGSADLILTTTAGTGPYEVVVNGVTYTGIASGGTIVSVSPVSTTGYVLESIKDLGVSPQCTNNDPNSTVTVSVNVVTAGTVTDNQTICPGGDPAAFTETAPAAGSSLTYQWQASTTNCFSGFSPIGLANAVGYDPPAGLTQTTYYRRIAISTLGVAVCTAPSNCLTVTAEDAVNPTPVCPEMPAVLIDASGSGSLLAYSNTTGPFASTDNCTVAQESYPAQVFTCADLGPQSVTLTVKDVAGNMATTTCNFNVYDDFAPFLVCPPSITVEASTGACTYIAGTELDPTDVFDNCGSVTLVNNKDNSASLAGEVFAAGTTTVEWKATDDNGLIRACLVSVTVQPCRTISGKLIFRGDNTSGVGAANVALSGDATATDGPTDTDGLYALAVSGGSDFTVTPSKTGALLNNVDALDAKAIERHLVAAPGKVITDFFRLVAADCDKSGGLTSIDPAVIRLALLNNPSALAILNATGSWRFIPTSYAYPDPAGPYALPVFPETRTYTGLAGSLTGQDFWGVKTGDVSNNANPANKAPGAGTASPLVWTVTDRLLNAGETVEATFQAYNFNDLAAWQFALRFDPSALEYDHLEILTTEIPLSVDGNFGLYQVAAGELRSVWAPANDGTLANGSPVFRIYFKALKGGLKLSELLALNPAALPGRAFGADLDERELKLEFEQDGVLGVPASGATPGLQLFQIQPNPFSHRTTVGFVLPDAAEAELRIFDATGRLLQTQRGSFMAGVHYLPVEIGNEAAPGLLYCELVTPFGRLSKKMLFSGK